VEILFGVHGLIDSVHSRELGLKTHHGMQGCALKALHTGGRVFGYRSQRQPGGVKLEIVESEATKGKSSGTRSEKCAYREQAGESTDACRSRSGSSIRHRICESCLTNY
jgi:hypothetical protein